MRRSSFALVLGVLASLPFVPACSCEGSASTSGAGASTSGGGGSGNAGGGGANTGGDLFGGQGGALGGAGGGGAQGGSGGGEPEPCVFVPPAGSFSPALECAWNGGSAVYSARDDVVSTPVVGNLTDDNGDGLVTLDDVPDIAFVTYRYQEDGCCNTPGALRVVSGACGADGLLVEHFTVGATEIEADLGIAGIWLDSSGGLAIGDIDSDGSIDVVATVVNGGTIAFERDGHVKWYQPDHPKGADHLAGSQPSIADLDADGHPEIIQGRVVLDGEDGAFSWKGDGGVGINAFLGPVSAASDLDLDGALEVLAGNTAYDALGTELWTFDFNGDAGTGCSAPGAYECDGFVATGNFDSDDQGEVVIVRAGVVYLVNHDGTPMMLAGAPVSIPIPKLDCAANEGGPPTVADFDGDGQAEIGVAAADYYVVVDLECLADPLPAFCSDPGIRWKVTNEDCSSRATGSSVFDFDGDGKAEVVYADEQTFRVFDGPTGATVLSIPNHSHTRLEMPIVADVDNDGNAEIVFAENGYGGPGQGIRVYGDPSDSWVPTRRIWNQHSYHVTNVTELGAIPLGEPINWLTPSDATSAGVMNNFRQNLPDFDVYAAPDLTVSLALDPNDCPAYLGLVATVCNEGALVVGAGVPVSFFDNATMAAIACANEPIVTTLPLSPGQCQTLTCQWVTAPLQPTPIDVRACVDNEGYACTSAPSGGNNECKEENNASDSAGLGCPMIN
jgi:hypothetical protein